MVTVVSVSRRYSNQRSSGNTIRRSKPKRVIFYYNDEGKLRVKRINRLQAIYYNLTKSYQRILVCSSCSRKYKVLLRKKNIKAYICDECSTRKDE